MSNDSSPANDTTHLEAIDQVPINHSFQYHEQYIRESRLLEQPAKRGNSLARSLSKRLDILDTACNVPRDSAGVSGNRDGSS